MSPAPKLSPERRAELIQRRRAGAPVKSLVREYGVSASYVKRVCPVIFPKVSAAVKARMERQSA